MIYDANDFLGRNEIIVDGRIKKTLNKKLWDENEELDKDVREAVESIVESFKEELLNYGINLKVVDTYLLGSNTGYNYNAKSDLDVHIVINKKKEECNKKHLRAICDMAKKIFNDKYDAEIKGIGVEVYVEFDGEINNQSPNIYSLKKGWIKRSDKPENKDIDNDAVKELVKRYKEKVDKCLKGLSANPDTAVNQLNKLITEIHDLRKDGLGKDGEFSVGNLAYKELRNDKTITKLKKAVIEEKNKKMSV